MKLSEFCNKVKCEHFKIRKYKNCVTPDAEYYCKIKNDNSPFKGGWVPESNTDVNTILHPESLNDSKWICHCKHYKQMQVIAKLEKL